MLTRRHIRVKVLQSIYALRQSNNPDLEKQEKFLFYSIDQMLDLYALSLQLLVEMRKADRKFLVTSQQKHLATSEEKNFSTTFLDNKVLDLIEQNEDLSNYIENKKLNKARVFFLPIQSIKQNANRVPGNSAKVVQISST